MTSAAGLAAGALRETLSDGWEVCATSPGLCCAPADVDQCVAACWLSAREPGTVAAILRAAGALRLDDAPRRLDAEDWWYRLRFEIPPSAAEGALHLGFDGLAGRAEVWLNGELLLRADNMFVAYERSIEGMACAGSNTLHLRFASLDAALAVRRARPNWRAPMVEHQQLRWFRTTLLGRMPGWTPPAPAIGLWRDVWLERRTDSPQIQLTDLRVQVASSGLGEVALTCTVTSSTSHPVDRVVLEIERAGELYRQTLARCEPDGDAFEGCLQVPDPALWWPHTHGLPVLYAARLLAYTVGNAAPQSLLLRSIGFRTLALNTTGDGFAVHINGVPVYCRGACWMPLDLVSLRAPAAAYRDAVAQAREAGMNMLRVSGATVYEDEAFFDACDEAGLLVWQDFMFANMDYPADDAGFVASVRTEVAQQLARWCGRPSLAIVCGNSEGEQQAAMWGAPRDLWQPALFHTVLRQMVQVALPDVPYWPSSAHGGAFPHQSDMGTSSYYGVGAYRRPAHDARRARVTFATECLGFSNVPEASAIARMPGGHALRVHHPRWKARAPRDLGAGWDFEDVRDHYLAELFSVDPHRCRSVDHDRYLALSRVVTGELMAAAFSEWRRPGSGCGGALVWFLRDLWAGAGWGLIDDAGVAKAAYHYLRRTLQPVAVLITDEGGNGLVAHVLNERAESLNGELCITLFGAGDSVVAQASHTLRMPGRTSHSLPLAACFDTFFDLSYAYRFGPAPVTLVHVCLRLPDGAVTAEAHFFPTGLPSTVHADVGLKVQLEPLPDGALAVLLSTQAFAQSVHIQIHGHECDDNYFHMAPGTQRRIRAQCRGDFEGISKTATIQALNSARPIVSELPQ